MKHTTLLIVAAAVAVAPPATSADREVREEINQVYEVGRSARLSLSNLNGDARVTGWDRGTIEVKATKRATGGRERLDDAVVHFNLENDHLRIEVEYEDNDRWNDVFVEVDFEIRVPRTTAIDEVELVNGGVEIRSLTGDVEASSVNGNVDGSQLEGEVRLAAVNGDVSLTEVKGDEDIRLSSVNGSVSIVLPQGVNAKLSASTVHGDIRGELARGVTHAGNSMDAVLGRGGTRISLDTVNGDIRIRRADGDRKPDPKHDAD